jgi:fructokinase
VPPPSAPLIGAIEAGGTKFVVAVGTSPQDIRGIERFPTTDPERTLKQVIHYLTEMAAKHGEIKALGIGSFGPVNLNPRSATYGSITTTPKQGWQHAEIVKPLRVRFRVPIGFDTDVNAAALGEALWGAGIGMDPLVYLTIGTGVGGGAIAQGRPLHGILHPEMGHIHVPAPRTPGVLQDICKCPFHKSCLEGFISGPAIAARWGMKAEKLGEKHPAWEEVAQTLAHGLVNIILTMAPRRIIIGGGVMQGGKLLPSIRQQVIHLLNGYLSVAEITHQIDQYIVPPALGDRSGVLGAMALGMEALHTASLGQV